LIKIKPTGDIIEEQTMEELTLNSSAFNEGETIPSRYTCDGEDISPPLSISNAPENTKSFVLIVDDPDIPEVVKKARLIEKFDHWIVFNIPAETIELEENYKGAGVRGMNTVQSLKYLGPCPPSEHEPTEHRYVFQLYALDTELELKEGSSESDVRNAMKGHMITKTELIGVYDRSKKDA
jgi:Raf kinase inhibitor-like YbhB/YbcL family protein